MTSFAPGAFALPKDNAISDALSPSAGDTQASKSASMERTCFTGVGRLEMVSGIPVVEA